MAGIIPRATSHDDPFAFAMPNGASLIAQMKAWRRGAIPGPRIPIPMNSAGDFGVMSAGRSHRCRPEWRARGRHICSWSGRLGQAATSGGTGRTFQPPPRWVQAV
jgi:hypothetical protein